MSIEDEKTDDLKDYNYLMKVESIEGAVSPAFSIKFWGWRTKDSPQKADFWCGEVTCEDMIGSVKTFVTARGNIIKIGIEGIDVQCKYHFENDCMEYEVRSVTLNITYIKTQTGGYR
jgi:hypothetical protein